MTIEKVVDFQELSLFLSDINKHKNSHIGFCGEKPAEIHQTLKEDFIGDDGDVTFFIARNNSGEIVAAIGLDIDETTAEVWGPFNQTPSVNLQHELWKNILNANPTVQTFEFFINKENTQQNMFMEEIKAEKTGEHLNLEMKEQDIDGVREIKSTPFVQSDFQAFEELHNKTFPNTYYDAKTIKERLNNENVLRVLKTKSNELQGYAYFEIDTEMEEASLEYIGISDEFQNKGLGTMMLKEALSEIFSYPQINEITLTVDNTNSQANHIYMKAGFKPKDVLISYRVDNA
ncbi:GNAT family N-acetyltransferase [Virgibacillus saliphilus]|uniref:GNAT family N-acetyltransferase n=1 Tax=Virgibacillus saliphilus TaxID=2831674 RepID=UPI002815F37D|nr:N-acetyltransferase [Virgibacillus sp. NKC19-3]